MYSMYNVCGLILAKKKKKKKKKTKQQPSIVMLKSHTHTHTLTHSLTHCSSQREYIRRVNLCDDTRYFILRIYCWVEGGESLKLHSAYQKKKVIIHIQRTIVLMSIDLNIFVWHIQWNLVIKRSDITKPSYNKVILLVSALYISLFFTLI